MRSIFFFLAPLVLAACGGGGGGGGGGASATADATSPSIASVAATDADGAGGATTITVTASDNVGVSQVTAQVSGYSAPGATNPVTLTAAGGNTFTGTITMMNGDVDPTPFTVTVTVRDAAGNSVTGTDDAVVEAASLPPSTP